MEKRNNRSYIGNIDPVLLVGYLRARKYLACSLVPFVILIVTIQIMGAYEMFFEHDQFKEKVNKSWLFNVFK